VLFSKKYNVIIESKHASNDGRLLLLNIELDNKNMTVINVYANNSEKLRKELFRKLEKWVNRYAKHKENIVIAGDMNCCLRNQDRSNQSHLGDKSRTTLENVLRNIDVKDTWGSVTSAPGFTFDDKRSETRSRLDYIFVSKSVCLCAEDVHVSVCPCVPDHNAVIVKTQVLCNPRGPGYWKMNNQLLENNEFNLNVKNIVDEIRLKYNSKSYSFIWETIKIRIKEMAVKLSINKARKEKNVKKCLQRELDEINLKGAEEQDRENVHVRKQILENKLNEIYIRAAKGAQLRSKANYIEKGEISMKYFKDLEKIHQRNNVIECIENEDGDEIYENVQILNECCNFYKKLFKSQEISEKSIDEYITQTEMPRLSDIEKELCDKEITENEVYEAIASLKTSKSPGIDGLSPEFYKKHWENIKTPFMQMLNESYINNELPCTLNQSVLTLIYKKGDRKLLKNYRPLSIGTYDYKIVAFVLAKRLQKVIKSIVNCDQSAYIKGRYIGLNARYVADFYDYCERFNKEGIILSLDFEKAFDRLEWNFMCKVLKSFNFGQNFIRWIKILYKKPIILIKNNGWMSEPIATKRGIRQGCPVSAMLFILAIELMAINIRATDEIKGIQIGTKERKLAQYADDSTLTLTSIESIGAAMYTINKYCKVSGMKLNTHKTEGIWLGPFKNNPTFFQGIKFTTDPVRILGLYIGHDAEICYNENWVKKINKVKNSIHVWKSRKLSLFGKVQLLKSLALSKVIYSLSLLTVKNVVVKELAKCFYSFLWKAKDRIKRNTLITNYNEGGINMVDIECVVSGLKAAWIPRLLNTRESESILNIYLLKNRLNINMLLNGNICEGKMFPSNVHLPEFYQQCITSFNSCKTLKTPRQSMHDFLTQPIWSNTYFTVKGKSLCFTNWIDSGIVWVKDLYDENGNFITAQYLFHILKCKRNWISEYKIVKKIVEKHGNTFNEKYYAKYENISKQIVLISKSKRYEITDQKCKFFYTLLVEKKKCRSIIEQVWSRELNKELNNHMWEKIYLNKIHCLPDNKMREFMYKFIHKLLPNRETLHKWHKVDRPNCPICHDIETIKHIYYDCKCSLPMWLTLGKIMNIDITWNKIISGFLEDIPIHRMRNLIFTIIMYARYKLWSKSTEEQITENELRSIVLKDIIKWNYIVQVTNFDKNHHIFKEMWSKLQLKHYLQHM